MRLVISGIGKTRAAAASAFLFSYGQYQYDIPWINFGVAGHGELALGSVLLAHKIQDVGSGKTWFPSIVFEPNCPSVCLNTYDQACLSYPHEHAVDMEAAGFYSMASTVSTSEIVHCIKIISDNTQHSSDQVNPKAVQSMIGAALDTIDELITPIVQLGEQLRSNELTPDLLAECTNNWHFSVYETNQLRQRLQRLQLLAPQLALGPYLRDKQSARQVLDGLDLLIREQLTQSTPVFP